MKGTDAAEIVRTTFQAIFAGDRAPFDEHPGLEALRANFPPMLAAFPDFSVELLQQVVEGNRVASHWVFRGTHRGPLYGVAATGSAVQFQNLSICRLEDGRIVQYNSEIGWMALLRQIGAWPPAR